MIKTAAVSLAAVPICGCNLEYVPEGVINKEKEKVNPFKSNE